MLLLELPSEILVQIFDYLGSSYFRSDLSRLTVCTLWSRFAHTACFREFYVTQEILQRFLSSPYVASNRSLVVDSMESLNLNLKGFVDWDSIIPPRHDSRIVDTLIPYTWEDSARGRIVREAWSTELNANLLNLANIIKQSRKLHILRIQAIMELHPLLPLLERRDYISLSTIRAFLSADNLTSLELDLCGTRLTLPPNQNHNEHSHICTIIAALLTTLRRLRLRMRTICPGVLEPQHNSRNLRLNEVIINLSASNESAQTTSAAHSALCASYPGRNLRLLADMEDQAHELVAQMAAPKMVRLLMHEVPSMEMRAFDVLTGRFVRLGEGAEWDDEGEAIEDEALHKELEVSDFSSDDDT